MLRFSTILFCLLCSATALRAEAPITTLAEVKALAPETCRQSRPVRLEATVTYPDPGGGGWFLHDGRSGIYLHPSLTNETLTPIHFGERFLVEAVTGPGYFLPDLYCTRLTPLPAADLPTPVLVTEENLFSPDLDCQWVQLTNVTLVKIEVRATNRIDLTLKFAGWTIPAFMSGNLSAELDRLLYRPMTLTAVGAETFNRQRQLTGRLFFVPDISCFHLQAEARAGDPAKPLLAHHLLRCDTSPQTLVRLRGIVTHATRDELFLRDKSGSVRVLKPDEQTYQPGDEVEAEGYAAIAPYRPVLCARQIQRLANRREPAPVLWRKEITDLSFLQSELVQLRAEFLYYRAERDVLVLHCRTPRNYFDAFLAKTNRIPADWEHGSQVDLVGIVQVTASHSRPSLEDPDGFQLTLRSAADMKLIQRPFWWTSRGVKLGIVIALLLVAVCGLWIVLLRRQVRVQTGQILQQVEREATLEERQRIARDLHDTVQQQMTGLAIQLDNVVDRLDRKPELVRSTLNLARFMARHCREETGNAIRNLRCVTLETQGLEAALQEKLPTLTAEGSAQLQFALAEKPVRFEAVAETYFLRIAQEAVANAVRHAQANTITVATQYTAAAVTLSIQDDGCGFDPQASPAPGHFGLSGLHERADKINAALTVDSAPGKGTTVRVVLELGRAAKSAL